MFVCLFVCSGICLVNNVCCLNFALLKNCQLFVWTSQLTSCTPPPFMTWWNQTKNPNQTYALWCVALQKPLSCFVQHWHNQARGCQASGDRIWNHCVWEMHCNTFQLNSYCSSRERNLFPTIKSIDPTNASKMEHIWHGGKLVTMDLLQKNADELSNVQNYPHQRRTIRFNFDGFWHTDEWNKVLGILTIFVRCQLGSWLKPAMVFWLGLRGIRSNWRLWPNCLKQRNQCSRNTGNWWVLFGVYVCLHFCSVARPGNAVLLVLSDVGWQKCTGVVDAFILLWHCKHVEVFLDNFRLRSQLSWKMISASQAGDSYCLLYVLSRSTTYL